MHSVLKLATSKGLFKKLKLGTLGGIAIGGVMGQLVMPKLLAKATAGHKLEGSNNVTLATGFQKQVAKPVQTQELSGAAPALPQSQDALSRRNLSLLQRKSLDSTEYEDPKDDLVSFESVIKSASPRRKPKPPKEKYTDVQQIMRKTIKRAENAKLFEGNLEAGQIAKAPEGGENVVWGYGSTFNIKDVEAGGAPISLKTIEQGFNENIKSATADAKSAFKHWKTKGVIREDQKFESLRPKERALLTDMAYQLGPDRLKIYEKLAGALSLGVSPSKKNVREELDVSWKDPKTKEMIKDKRRNDMRRAAYTN
jgi:hypothetical protein